MKKQILLNVHLSSPLVKGENYVGAIAGSVSGTVENCHVTYGSVEFVEASGGGIEFFRESRWTGGPF